MTIIVTGIEAEIRAAEEELKLEINQELRARSLLAFREIKAATPVDTGRARNSWVIGYDVSFNASGTGRISATLGPSTEEETIRITNGTGHIQYLEMGTSIQAPANFIRNILNKYFDEVNIQVISGELST